MQRHRAAGVLAVTTLMSLACLGGFAASAPAWTSVPTDFHRGPYLPLTASPEYGDGLGAGRGHEGQDMFAPTGTPEVAVYDGVIVEAGSGYQGGRGNYVSLFSPETDRTYNYFHMVSGPAVSRGQRVAAGQVLGRLGCSGSCWGPHLHFEVRRGRNAYGPVEDPGPFLQGLKLSREAGSR